MAIQIRRREFILVLGGALVAAGKRENGRDRNNLRPRGWSDVRNIAFNPVGKRVVTASDNKTARLALAKVSPE